MSSASMVRSKHTVWNCTAGPPNAVKPRCHVAATTSLYRVQTLIFQVFEKYPLSKTYVPQALLPNFYIERWQTDKGVTTRRKFSGLEEQSSNDMYNGGGWKYWGNTCRFLRDQMH